MDMVKTVHQVETLVDGAASQTQSHYSMFLSWRTSYSVKQNEAKR